MERICTIDLTVLAMIEYIEITIFNQSNGFMKITVDHPSLEKPIVTTSDEVTMGFSKDG